MEQFGQPNIVKQLHLDKEGREKVIAGANKLARAVASTLGASGRNVLVEDQFGGVQSTKDGVSVASFITLTDPVENMGSTLIKQAAKQTAKNAGDGTTSATVVAAAIINKYMDHPERDKHSFRDFSADVEKTRDYIIAHLDKKSIPVDDKMLEEVSIISANNDKKLGGLIAEAFRLAGEHGVVSVSDSTTNDTHVTSVDGTHVIETCVKEHFYTNPQKEIAKLSNPLILLASGKIDNVRDLQNVLEYTMKTNQSLLVVATLEQQPLSALALNNIKGNLKVNVISPPSFGLKQKDLLADLALLTGATVIDESLGDALDRITPDMLGKATETYSDKDGTTFITKHDTVEVNKHVKELKIQLDKEDHPTLKAHYERRLALLTGGVAKIFVGADTEVAQKEKGDRVDDATSAVKAARKEGVLPGGGAALRFAASTLNSKSFGEEILKDALSAPFEQLLSNSGLDAKNYHLKSWGKGVDTISGEIVDMVDKGIIDPTLVTKEVVKNAVSVALTILSSDVIISNARG